MKLEIKLKDPKYCDGCRWLKIEDFLLGTHCMEGFFDRYNHLVDLDKEELVFIRPQKCIEENEE